MTLRERGSVLEVRRGAVRVLRCLAPPETLDDLAVPVGARACRVAPDELLLIGEPAGPTRPPGRASRRRDRRLGVVDPVGEDAGEAFGRPRSSRRARLAPGRRAGVPAKAFVGDRKIQLLVAASLAHHVDERVRGVLGPARLMTGLLRRRVLL